MLNIFSIVGLLLVTSKFAYSDIIHRTECKVAEACVACYSTSDKFDTGYSEIKIPYQAILDNQFNEHRNNVATQSNISNMKLSIWMNEYYNLMKNMTLDIGDQNFTCSNPLTGDASHFMMLQSDAMVEKVGNNEEIKLHINELFRLLLTNSSQPIISKFDTTGFGCFVGVNEKSTNNRPKYFLRCLFSVDNFINTREIRGSACTNCARDDQCSKNYRALCVSQVFVESPIGSSSNMKRIEFYVINTVLLLVLSLKLGF